MTTRFRKKLCCALLLATAAAAEGFARGPVTPNDFAGSDTRRIRLAVEAAKGTTNSVTIPRLNANGSTVWMIDSAILLPSGMTVILDNCTLQLSDSCRDNMFRSDNVGIGIADPAWNENIAIIGVGIIYSGIYHIYHIYNPSILYCVIFIPVNGIKFFLEILPESFHISSRYWYSAIH